MEVLQNTLNNVETRQYNGLIQKSTLLLQNQYCDSDQLNLYKQLSKHKHCLAQKRWILLISPEHIPSVKQLNDYGIDETRILVVNKKQIKNAEQLVVNAMQSGSFSAILHWNEHRKFQVNNKVEISNTLQQEAFLQAHGINKVALSQVH